MLFFDVCFFRIKEIVCFGEGAGANIMARFAVSNELLDKPPSVGMVFRVYDRSPYTPLKTVSNIAIISMEREMTVIIITEKL